MKSGIYKIINIVTQKTYVGSSHYVVMRFGQHKYDLKNNRHGNSYLQRAWNKQNGWGFEFKIIEYCSIEQLTEREQYWIDTLKPEYNLTIVAGSNLGYKHTKETRNKMSIAKCQMTDETKSKISLARKGKKHSEETKKKIKNGNKNKIVSIETKRKMSLAAKEWWTKKKQGQIKFF